MMWKNGRVRRVVPRMYTAVGAVVCFIRPEVYATWVAPISGPGPGRFLQHPKKEKEKEKNFSLKNDFLLMVVKSYLA